MKKRILRPLPGMDLPFLILVLTLVGFGLVMLASASSAVALYRRGDAWAYLRPQLLYAALGLCGMWLASRVDYHIFHKLAWPLLGLSLILLAAVLFMPEYNGCKRWLVIPGFGTLQPSEIAKFAVVLVFSHIIALNHDRMKDFSVGVLPFALVLGVVAALMLLEPHLSGTVLILGIGAVLMFVGGTGLRWFLLAGVGGVGAIGAAVAVMPDLVPYAADPLLARSLCRPAGRRPPDHPEPLCHRLRRGHRPRSGGKPPEASFRSRASERLYFLHRLRGTGLRGGLRSGGAVRAAALPGHHHRSPRARPVRGAAGGGVHLSGAQFRVQHGVLLGRAVSGGQRHGALLAA